MNLPSNEAVRAAAESGSAATVISASVAAPAIEARSARACAVRPSGTQLSGGGLFLEPDRKSDWLPATDGAALNRHDLVLGSPFGISPCFTVFVIGC
jgi:hypothetical protein